MTCRNNDSHMARLERVLGENQGRNQKTMILLFVMLLVSTSIYGKDDNLPEIQSKGQTEVNPIIYTQS